MTARGASEEARIDQEENPRQIPLPGLPLEFGDERTRLGLVRQPPELGEHSREVLDERGFSNADIENLMSEGIVVAAS